LLTSGGTAFKHFKKGEATTLDERAKTKGLITLIGKIEKAGEKTIGRRGPKKKLDARGLRGSRRQS